MPFVPSFTVTSSADGLEFTLTDTSPYNSYGGKQAFKDRTLTLVLADGSTISYPDYPSFSFAAYPSDTITIDVNRDYAPLITLSVEDADVLTLETIAVDSYTADKGSNGNLVYTLKVTNNTTTPRTITAMSATFTGTFVAGDFPDGFTAGGTLWSNSTNVFGGGGLVSESDFFLGNLPITRSITSLSITVPDSGDNDGVIYLFLSININADATTGHTCTINGATNPLVLTVTGTPTQDNQQENTGATVTVGT